MLYRSALMIFVVMNKLYFITAYLVLLDMYV